MDPGLCPECAKAGKVSRLEFLIHDDLSLFLCEDNDCSYNYKGMIIARSREDSPLSQRLLEKMCSEKFPITLLKEPRLKYRHLKKLYWLIEIRSDIYYWIQEEIDSMKYSRLDHLKNRKDAQYQLTPSAKQIIELTDEEIEVCKHLIPDLRRIVITLRVQYEIHLSITKNLPK